MYQITLAGFGTGLKALGAGRHCSIAFSKSKSHRRKINSSTDRLRCGKRWANISRALSDTVRISLELPAKLINTNETKEKKIKTTTRDIQPSLVAITTI